MIRTVFLATPKLVSGRKAPLASTGSEANFAPAGIRKAVLDNGRATFQCAGLLRRRSWFDPAKCESGRGDMRYVTTHEASTLRYFVHRPGKVLVHIQRHRRLAA